MKSKTLKVIITSVFALAMALNTGILISKSSKENHTLIVLAEDNVEDEVPVSSEEEPSIAEEETPSESGEETPKEDEESATENEDSKSSKLASESVLRAIINTIKDALKDLIAHLKKYLKR